MNNILIRFIEQRRLARERHGEALRDWLRLALGVAGLVVSVVAIVVQVR